MRGVSEGYGSSRLDMVCCSPSVIWSITLPAHVPAHASTPGGEWEGVVKLPHVDVSSSCHIVITSNKEAMLAKIWLLVRLRRLLLHDGSNMPHQQGPLKLGTVGRQGLRGLRGPLLTKDGARVRTTGAEHPDKQVV